MNKTFALLSLALIVSAAMWAQKVIENPRFTATTADYVKITRIELLDTITKVDFEVSYIPKWWIKVSSSETHIINSNGGDKLFVKRADGIKMNEEHWTPESGLNKYTLYFPPLDKSIEKIDFMEESWKIFDIDISGKPYVPTIPVALHGDWLTTDGSNQWTFSFYDNQVIWRDRIWKPQSVTPMGKGYHLQLSNGNETAHLYLNFKKENVLIGTTPKQMQLYSRTQTLKVGSELVKDEKFDIKGFTPDSATYSGFIAGYHPKIGKTAMVQYVDVITGQHKKQLIEIAPDGSFSCRLAFLNLTQVMFEFGSNQREGAYIEPGKSLFHRMDMAEYNTNFQTYEQFRARRRLSRYMGESGRLNNELLAMDTIRYFNFNDMMSKVQDMSAADYKAYCLDVMKREQDALQQFASNHAVSRKAYQIMEKSIRIRAYESILSFGLNKERMIRKSCNIPNSQRDLPYEIERVEPSFFDFMTADELNDPMSLMVANDYYYLINRLQYHEQVRPSVNYRWVALKDSLQNRSVTLTDADLTFLDGMIACKRYDEENKKQAAGLPDVVSDNMDLLNFISTKGYQITVDQNLKKFFGLDKGLATDIMKSQSFFSVIQSAQRPFNDEERQAIDTAFTVPFIAQYLLKSSDDMQQEIAARIEANKHKTGYKINETPKTESDKIFDAMMANYKGKVVVVDFWATWCGPCRSSIEEMKSVKEELAGKDVEFVYITNDSSPLDTWNMMIPDIKGQHYRVNPDEWNYLSSKFNISGIPHYVLVNKNGEVVNPKFAEARQNESLKRILETQLLETDVQ